MKVRQILIAIAAFAVVCVALSAGAQAAKPPKPKDYTYCVSEAKGSGAECFKEPLEVFSKTKTWRWVETGQETAGTYSHEGKSYVFKETKGEGNKDELIGTKGKKGVISGTLYENGAPSEFNFTLTPVKG
jgi:hypothetical protein